MFLKVCSNILEGYFQFGGASQTGYSEKLSRLGYCLIPSVSERLFQQPNKPPPTLWLWIFSGSRHHALDLHSRPLAPARRPNAPRVEPRCDLTERDSPGGLRSTMTSATSAAWLSAHA